MTKLAIIALFAAFVLWMVMWQGKQYKAFLEGAKKASGTVVGKVERARRPDQPTRKENWLLYSYQVGDKTFTGEERVEFADLWGGFSQGQAIEIYYSEKKPEESHPVVIMDRRAGTAGKLSQ